MREHHRIYPKKARKPVKSDETIRREKRKRAHRRIAKGRVKRAVAKWPESKELARINANPVKKNLYWWLPYKGGKSPRDEANPDE